jgi:hypothetical protein
MTAVTVLDQILVSSARRLPLARVDDDRTNRNGDIVLTMFPDAPNTREFTLTRGEAMALADALFVVAERA